MNDFVPFPQIPRLRRDITITEKIDGTNAQIDILHMQSGGDDCPEGVTVLHSSKDGDTYVWSGTDMFRVKAGSRKQWISPESDNFGFAAWVRDNAADLVKLGEGRHFGEWWGSGIQRGYGLEKGEKRFSLFNVKRWYADDDRPACVNVVPVLYMGPFCEEAVDFEMEKLSNYGSVASPDFMNPEGIIVYHHAANSMFKVTIHGDEAPKGAAA